MSGGPYGKGPRLWLQPERKNRNGSIEGARWVIRDGSVKRSTGCTAQDIAGAERALKEFIAEKHDPRRNDGDPARVLIFDVLNVYAQDVAPRHARPKETASRIARLAAWWGDAQHAVRTMAGKSKVQMTGFVADINSASCRACPTINWNRPRPSTRTVVASWHMQ